MVLKTVALGAALWSGSAALALAQQPTGAGASPSNSSPISEVIVTAQRRTEKVQDVPIAVTVVSQSQLDRANITTTTDLVRAVPELTATDQGVFQIRGIGTQGYGRSAEGSVSVVLDGVVLARDVTNALYDLDNVEVLSGPQGTLFGKNSNAGVINIVTKAPVLNTYQAIGHIDAGDHDYIDAYGIVNLPIGDEAALRVSYHHVESGHIVYNTLYHLWDDNTDDGVRARLLWRPNDRLTINLSGDYQKLGSNGVNGVADFAGVAVYSSAPPGSALAATLAGCGIVASPSNNKVCANSLYQSGAGTGDTYGRKNGGAALQIDYKFWGDLTFTSITALRESVNEDSGVDGDLAGEFGDTLPQNILDRNLVPFWDRNLSEEARIQSPSADRLNFSVGAYYSDTKSHDKFDQSGQFGIPLGTLEYRRLTYDSISATNEALFGQVNYHLTPQLEVLLGGRVTHDSLTDYSFNAFPDAYPAGPYLYTGNTGFFSTFPINTCTLGGGNPDVPGSCPAGTSLTAPGKLNETGYTGKIGLQYQLNPSVMFFSTLTRGYKGPFINEAASYPILASQLVIHPEYPTDFELGVKSTFFNRLAVDVTLFNDLIEGFQTTIYVPPSATQQIANFIQGNAPHALTRGVQLDVFGKVTQDFDLNGGLIYNDAHFNNGFQVACSTGPCPALHQLPFSPRWKATTSGEYHHRLTDRIDGFLQGDFVYTSPYPYGSAPGFPGSPSRYLLGGRLGARTEDKHWSLAIFCRNCLDKRYPILASPDGFAGYDGGATAAGLATYQFLTIDSYRVVGVSLDANF